MTIKNTAFDELTAELDRADMAEKEALTNYNTASETLAEASEKAKKSCNDAIKKAHGACILRRENPDEVFSGAKEDIEIAINEALAIYSSTNIKLLGEAFDEAKKVCEKASIAWDEAVAGLITWVKNSISHCPDAEKSGFVDGQKIFDIVYQPTRNSSFTLICYLPDVKKEYFDFAHRAIDSANGILRAYLRKNR